LILVITLFEEIRGEFLSSNQLVLSLIKLRGSPKRKIAFIDQKPIMIISKLTGKTNGKNN